MAQEKWLVEGAKTIDVGTVRKLKVGLVAGQVDILGTDETTARVEVHSVHGKPLKVAVEGDTLVVDHPQVDWTNWLDAFRSFKGSQRADVSIQVPRDIALKLGVVSATALVTGLTEDASVSTVSGDVVVDRVYGDLSLNSVSGELQVREHYGAIGVKTVSGDVTAQGELMGFTCEGVSSDVFLDATGIPDGVRVNTVSGDVTLRLAHGVPMQAKINTVSGKLQLDDQRVTGVRGGFTWSTGALEGRWTEFKANTVSGDVSVLHAAAATPAPPAPPAPPASPAPEPSDAGATA